MQFESQIEINANPENIFKIYSEVNQWSNWDPDTKYAYLHGDFSDNSLIDLQIQSGTRVQIRLVKVIRNKSFITESKLPLCTIRMEHILQPFESKTLVTHRILFSGIFKYIFSFMLAAQMKESLSQTLLALKDFVES
ncbi:MAG: hypothetical protein F6K24_04955 [Okeania sp. SIO2D1]|nr:hypothetical protein [Okeania sp. SIO2D1]